MGILEHLRGLLCKCALIAAQQRIRRFRAPAVYLRFIGPVAAVDQFWYFPADSIVFKDNRIDRFQGFIWDMLC